MKRKAKKESKRNIEKNLKKTAKEALKSGLTPWQIVGIVLGSTVVAGAGTLMYLGNGKGKKVYSNGDTYHGDFVNFKKHGKGKYTWSDGVYYEGEFKNGKMDGKGKMTFNNGNVYYGEWKDDKKHGQGKMTSLNGDVYYGEWKDGKKHGQGKWTFNKNPNYKLNLYENHRIEQNRRRVIEALERRGLGIPVYFQEPLYFKNKFEKNTNI